MKKLVVVSNILITSLILQGCNLFGSLDKAKSREEIHADALAKLDAGNCGNAITELNTITNPNDQTYRLQGWANLCAAGIKLKNVLSTLMTYSSSSNNINIVGTLANSIIPQSDTTITNNINPAIMAFGNQSAGNDRMVNVILGNLIKAAAYLAKNSANGSAVLRSDVATSACLNQTCAGTPTCNAGMSDADANNLGTALVAAGGAVNSSLGALADLGNKLAGQANNAGTAAAAQINRCVIYNNVLSQ